MTKIIICLFLVLSSVSLFAGLDILFSSDCDDWSDWMFGYFQDNQLDNPWHVLDDQFPPIGSEGDYMYAVTPGSYGTQMCHWSMDSPEIYPAGDFSEYDSVHLSFTARYSISDEDPDAFGGVKLYAPGASGGWAQTFVLQYHPGDAGNTQYDIDITDFANGKEWIKFWFEFKAQSWDGCEDTQISVDNVKLYGVVDEDPFPGKCLRFDGSDYSEAGTFSLGNDYCIESWFRAYSSSDDQTLIDCESSAFPGTHNLVISMNANGNIEFKHDDQTFSSAQVTSSGSYGDNEWHHFEAVKIANDLYLYIDGVLDGSVSAAMGLLPFLFPVNVVLGKLSTNDTNYFTGKMDELIIWNTFRTQEEIQSDLNLVTPVDFQTMLAYFQFNEDEGSTIRNLVLTDHGDKHGATRNISRIPIGCGTSSRQTISSSGVYDFTGTGVSMDFNSVSSSLDFVITRIDLAPNELPVVDHVLDDYYWVIKKYNSGTFDADLSLEISENVLNSYEYKLFRREWNSRDGWTYLDSADEFTVGNNNTTFNNFTDTGQLIVGRVFQNPEINTSVSALADTLIIESTLETEFNISNVSTEGVLEYNISLQNRNGMRLSWLDLNPTSGQCAVGESDEVTIFYDSHDLAVGDHTANIIISTNDPDNLEFIIPVTLTVPPYQGTFPTGDGTASSPYQIATLENLLWLSTVNTVWDRYYIQTNDIDAADTQNWNNGEGFSPIGIDDTNSFSGNYDGQEFIIDSLFISRNANIQGLFGYTNGAEISNVNIRNFNITANSQSAGLVGFNTNSLISNCSATGIISGDWTTAGLVGRNNSSEIKNCYADVEIYAAGDRNGGLVGTNDYSSIISNCYSLGSIICTEDKVGGFAGENNRNSLIENCYSNTLVSGGINYIGGFIGYSLNGAVANNSFWNTETSGHTSSAGGTGKTTAEMQSQSTFTDADWDFIVETQNGTEDHWSMSDSFNNGFPYLTWQVLPDILVNPTSITKYLLPGETEIQLLEITNEALGADLNYNVSVQLTGQGRSGADLYIDSDSLYYYPGNTYDITLWIAAEIGFEGFVLDFTIEFPFLLGLANIQVNSISDFTTNYGGVYYVTGFGPYTWYHQSGTAFLEGEEDYATATANVTVPSFTTGDKIFNYEIHYTDVLFNDDYYCSDSFTMLQHRWVWVNTSSGTCRSGETDQITVNFDANINGNNIYNANIIITSNDPDEPETLIPVTLHIVNDIILTSPQNLNINTSDAEVQLTWNQVAGANSYKVFSSDDPDTGFTEDTTGTFDNNSWSAPITETKRFYYVKAVN